MLHMAKGDGFPQLCKRRQDWKQNIAYIVIGAWKVGRYKQVIIIKLGCEGWMVLHMSNKGKRNSRQK